MNRSFYYRTFPASPDNLTMADLTYMFYSALSGLTTGTVNDHIRAFYLKMLGLPSSILTMADLEMAYYQSLSIDISKGIGYAEATWLNGTVDATTGAWTAP